MVEVGLDLVEEEWSHEVENKLQNHIEKLENKRREENFTKFLQDGGHDFFFRVEKL